MIIDVAGFAVIGNSVGDALAGGLKLFSKPENLVLEESRNGPVAVAKGPVLIRNDKPMNRVLFSAKRNANPFFHFMEALWMLAGRKDLPVLTQFNKQMTKYSDDGGLTQPAAYGHRWRSFFGVDQIKIVINELRNNPNSRRAVLSMWGPANDLSLLAAGGADVPCNTNCFFTVRNGKLHMSVQCRSNDMWWGAHGANAVHFSILQEYIAAHLVLGVGAMFQYAWNYHLYTDVVKGNLLGLAQEVEETDLYASGAVSATPLFTPDDVIQFDEQLPAFMNWVADFNPAGACPSDHPTLLDVAAPMLWAWKEHKQKDYLAALDVAFIGSDSSDWQRACVGWLERAKERHDENP